ncbi:beta-lactamase family protein [Massilia sp. B-10]|nr:beta-lactamase family protein [Massilia sp. B-10]
MQQLAAEGKLALTDHVFCSGDNSPCWLPAPMLPPSHDSRVRDITIAHLINHTGGWDRGRSGEPYGSEIEVVRNLALTRAPTRAELIRHQMARPLDAAPGASMVYSNFGYLLLAEVIERAGGEAYVAQVQRGVFAPIGVGAEEFKGARSLLADRDVREPHYVSDRMAPGVFSGGQSRLAKDEFAVLENWVSVAWRYRQRARDGQLRCPLPDTRRPADPHNRQGLLAHGRLRRRRHGVGPAGVGHQLRDPH